MQDPPTPPRPPARQRLSRWWRRSRLGAPVTIEEGAPGLTTDGRLRSGRLAGRTLRGALWVLTWPVLVESFLNSFVGLTDTVLAAAINDGGAATDAIGLASYTLWLIGLIVAALGVGATALISRAVGGGRFAVASAGLTQTVMLATTSGVVVGALVAAASGPAARAMALSPEATEAFRVYMLVNALGVPFSSLLFAGIACARGAGDSVSPLRAMLVVNAVNLVASWTLAGVDLRGPAPAGGSGPGPVLLANPFPFDLGVAGIAWGTVLSQVVGAAVMLRTLVRGVHGVRLRRSRLRPHWHTVRRLVRVGWPNFLETLGMWAGNFLIILMVSWLAVRGGAAGAGPLGAHQIAIRLESFSFLPGFAISLACATLVGQYLGAGSAAMARRAVVASAALACALMGALGVVFIVAPRTLVSLVSGHEVHLLLAPPLLVIAGVVQIPFAASIVLRSALRGAGDVKGAMWITWASTYLVRLPLAYACSGVEVPLPSGGVLPNPFTGPMAALGVPTGLSGLWIGLCAEIVVRAGLFAWRFRRGAWERMRV